MTMRYSDLTDEQLEEMYKAFQDAPKGGKLGVSTQLGDHYNVNERTIRKWMSIYKNVRVDSEDESHLFLKGKSDYINYETGETVRGWKKYDTDKQKRYEAIKQSIIRLADNLPSKLEIPLTIDTLDQDLLVSYKIGDAHLGLYAWEREAGNDYSLDLGINLLTNAIQHLVSRAPNASTAIIQNLGDFYHSDNKSEETRSGNKLDVDGRWAKVMEAGIAAMITLIEVALTKHAKVVYIGCRGNHDDHTAMMLAFCLKSQFKDNPRVEITDSVPMFHYYQFGTNMLCSTHGHTIKHDRLPLIAAVDQPQMWAATQNRHWSVGHIHHKSVQEYPGITVSSYNTLAAQDSWHRESGYRSNRTMTAVTYHKDTGTVGTHELNPSMLTNTKVA